MSVCMSGTRGSGVLSSTGDVLVRGVGGVCDMCMCLARGGVGEWMRELGLGFTNPVGTGGVLDMCLCFDTAGLHGQPAQKTVNRVPIDGVGGFDTICIAACQNRCDSSTTCKLCHLEPYAVLYLGYYEETS